MNRHAKHLVLFGADPSDLVFYLRDQNDIQAPEGESGRYAIRRKYWAYALPQIKEAFGNEGPFSAVNPCPDNWVAGYFRVGGFNISCTANYDGASVHIYLGKSEKEKNKEAFDFLYSHKSEIESAFGNVLEPKCRSCDSKVQALHFGDCSSDISKGQYGPLKWKRQP